MQESWRSIAGIFEVGCRKAKGQLPKYLRLDAGKLEVSCRILEVGCRKAGGQLQEYVRLDAGKLEVSCRNT